MKKYLIITILMIFVLVACREDRSVSQIYNFTGNTWQRFNYLNFEFPIDEANQTYDVMAMLRVTEDFPSQALIFNLVMTLPSGEERIREYKIEVRDDDESMLGEKKTGYYERLMPIRKQMRLHETGILKFEIESLMTKYYTPGVVEFGIVLEPSE
jgi:gliding motility-associated lipoprotein GldH